MVPPSPKSSPARPRFIRVVHLVLTFLFFFVAVLFPAFYGLQWMWHKNLFENEPVQQSFCDMHEKKWQAKINVSLVNEKIHLTPSCAPHPPQVFAMCPALIDASFRAVRVETVRLLTVDPENYYLPKWGERHAGSAMFLTDRYFLTNYHVVEDETWLRIAWESIFMDIPHRVEVVAVDPFSDLALLAFPEDVPSLEGIQMPVWQTTLPMQPQVLTTIGYPQTNFFVQPSLGPVRIVLDEFGPAGLGNLKTLHLTTPGHSGSSLYSCSGGVMGLVHAYSYPPLMQDDPPSFGPAISISTQRIVTFLRSTGLFKEEDLKTI